MLELQSRMNSSESSAEELRKRNSALASELPFLRTRLRASESTVEQLRRKNTVLASRLCGTETLLEELRGQMTEFMTSNSSSMVMIPDAAALQNLLDGRLEKLQARTEDQFSEMRLELNSSQILLDQLRRGVAAQAASVTQLQVRMNEAEELEDVHTETADEMSLMDLWRKLNRSESLQDQVNTEMEERLRAGEKQLDDLQTQRSDVELRLRSTETHLEQLEAHTAALEVTLRVREEQLEHLDSHTSDQISSIESRLTDGLNRTADQISSIESRLTDGLNRTADVELRLRSTETHLEQLEAHTAALEVTLRVREEQLEHLDSHTSDQISSIESRLTDGLNRTAVQISSIESRLTDGLNRTADVELRLRSTETHLEQLEAHTAALEVTLRVREEQLEHLDSHTSDQISSIESRLTDGLNRTADVELRLRSTETHLEQLEAHTAALEVTLRVREEQLEHLDSHTSDQISSIESRLTDGLNRTADQISSIESRLTDGLNRTADVELRLRSTETHLEQLEAHTAVFTLRLNVTEQLLDELQTESAVRAADLRSVSDGLTEAQEELQVRLGAVAAAVEELNTEGGEELRVGFSAGLTDSGVVGPFDQETTLVFSKTIINVGHAYNQSAGVFTAPVGGVYFFSFTAADYLKGYMGLHLYRNEQPVFFSLELNDHGGYASSCSSVALQLERGDRVRLSLPASYRLYDDSRNFSVFSGFLLFPL
ncbi:myosin-11 isoform X7 [Oryzias melastigma]|uniref:myosin-11 isoform X7 n=1 Tax=Oryzias melastigma TaxID=30732 RepID=UPI00168D9469|nr:myosin-11 isoform X7 [Oryzias melastigma]